MAANFPNRPCRSRICLHDLTGWTFQCDLTERRNTSSCLIVLLYLVTTEAFPTGRSSQQKITLCTSQCVSSVPGKIMGFKPSRCFVLYVNVYFVQTQLKRYRLSANLPSLNEVQMVNNVYLSQYV